MLEYEKGLSDIERHFMCSMHTSFAWFCVTEIKTLYNMFTFEMFHNAGIDFRESPLNTSYIFLFTFS